MNDDLAGEPTKHWTGAIKSLTGLVRIDGHAYRLMGPNPGYVAALKQTGVQLTPTQTIYTFSQAGVELRLSFLSPLLPQHLDWFSRPVSYLTWQVRSTDGREHAVALYFDHAAELVVDRNSEQVAWARWPTETAGAQVMQVGSATQPVLVQAGDRISINWGYLYQAAPAAATTRQAIGEERTLRGAFAARGELPQRDDQRMPRAADDAWPVLATTMDLGRVGAAWAEAHIALAYDDLYSVAYLGQKLRPYWRRSGAEAADLIRAVLQDYPAIVAASEAFDQELSTDLLRLGGPAYQRLAILAYRQAWAAHKLVAAPDGSPWLFSKESSSNGCMSTVDVSFPASPLLLLLSPTLMKALLVPVLDYASSPRWRFPFAPHDIGTYPLASGQVYGGGEESTVNQMPVEETGNMLLMIAAIAKADGNAAFAEHYWPLLSTWATYLKNEGFDPANQLASEDFTGYLAHNTNLSVKAILALAAYGRLSEQTGRTEEGQRYRALAQRYGARWLVEADDGDHFRLAFDRPSSWSTKYNLVWDKVLDLGVFSDAVRAKESRHYQAMSLDFGLPLDSRATYTLLHTAVWGASIAGVGADFTRLMQAIGAYMERTPNRIPLSDWFDTASGKSIGFQARSVVGGVYLPMLYDGELWSKWRQRGG